MKNLWKIPFKVLNYYLVKLVYSSFPDMNYRLKSLVHFFILIGLIMLLAFPMREEVSMIYLMLFNVVGLVSPFIVLGMTADAWNRFYKNDQHCRELFGLDEERDITVGASPDPSKGRKRRAVIKYDE
jgi:hypothetical protein